MTRTPKCFALSFYSGPRFVRIIHHHGWPYTAWLILLWNEISLWFTWPICSVYCDYDFYSFSPLVGKDMKLMESSWWERLCGKLDLVLVGGVMLPKSWVKFSVDRWGCAPSLLLALSPNYGWGNEGNGDLFQNEFCGHCFIQCPCLLPNVNPCLHWRHWALIAKPGPVSSGNPAHHFLLLMCTRFWLCPTPNTLFPSPVEVL